MAISKESLIRARIPLFSALALVLLAVVPLIKTGLLLEYDADDLKASIMQLLSSGGYFPDRAPGSPAFSLPVAFGVSLLRHVIGIDSAFRAVQYLNLFLSLGTLVLLAPWIRARLKSPWSAFFAILAIGLHPIFLSNSFALVEDVFGLFFGVLAWRVAASGAASWAAIFLALAVNSKAFAIGLLPVVVHALQDSRPKGKSAQELVTFGAQFVILAGMLYLPAFAAFGMDWGRALKRDHYGTTFAGRARMGAILSADVLNLWIPFLIFWMGQKAWIHRFRMKRPSLEASVLGILAAGFLLEFARFSALWPAILVSMTLILTKKRSAPRALACSTLLMLSIFLTGPYARGFLLQILPPLIMLLTFVTWRSRRTEIGFWATAAAVTFLPMIFYFHVDPAKILWVPRGYYDALSNERDREYNDGGFFEAPDAKTLRFPWGHG